MFTDAETDPAKEMLLLAIKEKCFCALDKKKMILRKKIYVGNWFLAGLCSIHLAKSQKISVAFKI